MLKHNTINKGKRCILIFMQMTKNTIISSKLVATPIRFSSHGMIKTIDNAIFKIVGEITDFLLLDDSR